jgi:thiamine-phosphate pyrophosphorylase
MSGGVRGRGACGAAALEVRGPVRDARGAASTAPHPPPCCLTSFTSYHLMPEASRRDAARAVTGRVFPFRSGGASAASARAPRGEAPALVRRAPRGASGPPWRRALPRLLLFSDPVRLPDPRSAARRLPPGAAVVARARAGDPGRVGGSGAPAAARAAGGRRRARGAPLPRGVARAGPAPRGGAAALPARPPLPRRAVAAAAARGGGTGWEASHAPGGCARTPVVLSPVFPTASHPGAAALGPLPLGPWPGARGGACPWWRWAACAGATPGASRPGPPA